MRFGGIALAAVLLVGACSGDPSPKEPTGSPSKPTPTSTATLPAMPDQAKEDSPEGAAAFVTYWVEVLNYASETGDVEELSRLSSPECEGCQRYITLFHDIYEAGGYSRGNTWTAGDLRVDHGDPETYLDTEMQISAGEAKASSEAEIEVDEASSIDMAFAATRGDGEWRMSQVAVGQSE